MLKNYLKIAFRNILRNKLYSFINIAGLAIGIACFTLIFSYVRNEMSYDTFHKNASKIYRINTLLRAPGSSSESILATAPDPLTSVLRNDYPGMFKVARLFFNQFWVTRGDKAFQEFVFASDSSFFNVFSFKLLEGDSTSALGSPNSVVITKEFAGKLFGNEDPMGKTLKIDNYDFVVTGVLSNFPENSSIKFDVLIPARVRDKFDPGWENKWNSIGTYTFVSFTGKMTPGELSAQFPSIIQKYDAGSAEKGAGIKLELEPLTNIHLDPDVGSNYMVPPVSRTFLYILMVIGISILLISCANFTNVSVSKYADRAKEIGMRKVMGAQRSQVIGQFLCESVLISMTSLIIGTGLAELSLNGFRVLTGKEISLYPLLAAPNVFIFVAFGIFVGLIAGSYPAIFLSSYKPASVLAKQAALVKRRGMARNVLVVGQFVIAAILVSSVLLIRRQIDYMEHYDMGLKPEGVVAIPMDNEVLSHRHLQEANTYVNLIKMSEGNHGITSAAVSENIPGDYFNNTFSIIPAGSDANRSIQMIVSSMDENFLDTYGIQLVEGRNFSPARGSDEFESVIINERAAKLLGWKNPIGMGIDYNGEHHVVIGVMKDINIESLQRPMVPMVYRYAAAPWERLFVSVRLNPLRYADGVNFLRKSWKNVFPHSPFDYFFVNDKYMASYMPEKKTEKTIEVFSALAIFLAGLGLFGLSSLKVTQRTKEIGVRKVLGASIPDILRLFSREFLLLVLAGNLVAAPVAYFILSRWLEGFAFRTDIGAWIFVTTAALTLVIAFVTVSLQSLKAAAANPVESLRYE